jgi:hypothetical protein
MKYLLFSIGLILVGCVSVEERCVNETNAGYFGSVQQCIAFRYQQQQQAGAALQQAGASLNGGQSPLAPAPRVDLQCKNDCLTLGYQIGYCDRKCSY